MDVVYASDDNYAVYAGVSIRSLCAENQSAKDINIYVISIDISAENKKRLEETVESYGRNIYFMDISRELNAFSREVDAGSYGINVFGRFFMGKLLPESIERVLYLDCDTVINGDISELFSMDMGENTAMAVQEPTIYKSILKSIGLKPSDPYFNSGVILVDFKKWVLQSVSEELLECYKREGDRFFCGDQDTINLVLRGRIGKLSPKYNFFTNYRYFSYSYLTRESSSYGDIGEREFEEAKRAPVIIHYLGTERPWVRGNLNPYRKIYENHLRETPFKGMGEIRGRELSMLLFHAMELMTLCFPFARRRISAYYEKRQVMPRTMRAHTEEKEDR